MRQERKIIYKKLVSCICIVTMLMHVLLPQNVLGATTDEADFLELTFSDYDLQGTYDGTDEIPLSVNGNATGINNMDNVAFNGCITFQDTTETIATAVNDSVRIGGLNAGGTWLGLTIFYDGANLVLQDYTSGGPVEMCTVSEEQAGKLTGTSLTIRLTCQYVNTNDVHITFSVNGMKYYDDICADIADKLGAWAVVTSYVRAITVESVNPIDITPYDTKTLLDLELPDKTIGETIAEESVSSTAEGTLENVAIEGVYQFSDSGNMVFFGGAWKGLYLQSYAGELMVRYMNPQEAQADRKDRLLGTITAADADMTTLTGVGLPIRMSFAFSNKTDTSTDVTVGVEINEGYQNYYHIQNASLATLAKTVHLYAAAGTPLSYSSVGYTNLTVDDFGFDKVTTVRAKSLTHTAGEGNLDRVSIVGYYTFTDSIGGNAVYYGNMWEGFRIDTRGNGTLGFMQVELGNSGVEDDVEQLLGTISSQEAGMELTNTSIKLQVTFKYIAVHTETVDVKVSVIVNDVYCVTYTLRDFYPDTLARTMFVWSSGSDMPLTISHGLTPSPKLLEVTPTDFGIADNTYEYNAGDLAIGGKLLNEYTNSDSKMAMNGKILSADVQFLTTGASLQIGGNDGLGWNGVWFKRINDTQFQFYRTESDTTLQMCTIDAKEAGLTSAMEDFNLKISFEYVDYDRGGEKNDVRYGLWFNDTLYNGVYIYSVNDANYYGNCMGVYCATESDTIKISSPKRIISEFTTPYILEDFGLKTVTYNQTLIDELGTIDSYSSSVEMDMSDVSLSGKISISSGADIRLFGKGVGDTPWEGYCFSIDATSDNLTLKHTCSEDTNGDDIPENTVSLNLSFPEVTSDEQFQFTLTQRQVDADADGVADDVQMSIWLNGSMYGNRYFYLLDFADYVQGRVLLYPNTGEVEVTDSVDVEVYNLANKTNQNGYLIAGKGSLTVNKETCQRGDTIQTVGDYIIRCADNGTYVKKVVLYNAGDAHPDSTMNIKDLVAVKKAATNEELDTQSGLKAADVNADGVVDTVDYDSIVNHLLDIESIVPKSDTFVSYDEDVMPIGGFFGPYRVTVNKENYEVQTFDYLTDDIFDKIQKLGINLITYTENNYVTSTADVIKQLELAEAYGIDVYLKDSRITTSNYGKEQVASAISDYIQYNSFKGFAVIDEPTTDYYGTTTTHTISKYAPLASAFNGYCNLIGSVNLNPKTWSLMPNGKLDILKVDDAYERYVEEYLTSCNPKVLSMDYYVFDQPSQWKTKEGYFDNLEVMRVNALEHGVTFWNFIQAGKSFSSTIKEPTTNNMPTEGQLLWNVNTSLAYGAKGIQYFTLIQPHYFAYEKTKNEDGSYTYGYDFKRNGLIGANGVETSWYPWAAKANKQIAAVDEVLMHTTSQDVLVVGMTAQKETGKSASQESLIKYDLDSIEAPSGAVVGAFDYRGKTAFYVVNYDYENPQTVTLNFDGSKQYSVISATTNSQSFSQTCALDLEKGGAALVVVE